MTNYSHGHEAEKVAAAYLRRHGYEILELNWRHVRAEIDIVARRKRRWGAPYPLVLFEVKYRKTDQQGRGLEYITPAKLRQMAFAAELYTAIKGYAGEYTLGAIELSSEEYRVTHVIESISL